MSNPIFDLLVRGENGQLIAATEVKAYQDLTPDKEMEKRNVSSAAIIKISGFLGCWRN